MGLGEASSRIVESEISKISSEKKSLGGYLQAFCFDIARMRGGRSVEYTYIICSDSGGVK